MSAIDFAVIVHVACIIDVPSVMDIVVASNVTSAVSVVHASSISRAIGAMSSWDVPGATCISGVINIGVAMNVAGAVNSLGVSHSTSGVVKTIMVLADPICSCGHRRTVSGCGVHRIVVVITPENVHSVKRSVDGSPSRGGYAVTEERALMVTWRL